LPKRRLLTSNLRTLLLASSGRNAHWKDHCAIPELYSILQSTPAITTLYLEGEFLSLCTHSTPALLSALGDAVAPLWHHAPHLATLQIHLGVDIGFEGIAMTIEEVVELFVCNLFLDDGGWLDLQTPACPIELLMVNDGQIRNFMKARDAEVRFRTGAENRNRPNRTDGSGSVRFRFGHSGIRFGSRF
jgi:hypothetical protein